jgi:hypothetical protein
MAAKDAEMKKYNAADQNGTLVPKSMRVQLARLFGSDSKQARSTTRSPAEWRKTLKVVLHELERYVADNVDTDELHRLMLLSGLRSAEESLQEEPFWPGYVEGITRLALILLGDYPDHRKRTRGRKKDGHYKLDAHRTGHWAQSPRQRFRTLIAAGMVGFPTLSALPRDVPHQFRREFGFGPSQDAFLEWYRATNPKDYAALFR